MLHIKCPFCGMRSQNEFAYGGDASVKRPELNKEVSDKEWDDFVYNRKSPRGKTFGIMAPCFWMQTVVQSTERYNNT